MILFGLEFVLAKLLLGGLIVGGIAAIAFLTFEIIKSWFEENRTTLSDSESDAVAMSVKKELDNGEVVYVQGFFDQSTDKMVKKRVIKPEDVDTEVDALHRSGKVVVYQ